MSDSVTLTGLGIGRGGAVGPVVRAHPAPQAAQNGVTDASREQLAAQVTQAFADVAQALQRRAQAAAGTTLGEVLEAAAAMAADPEYVSGATGRVADGVSPAVAVDQTTQEFAELFAAAGGYLAERVTDLRSVRDRVVARLLGLPEPGVPALSTPSVLVAADLAPADTATLDMDKVLAMVLAEGGPTGHTAIIAGQLGIPCVVRVAGAQDLHDGALVAVDAANGTVTIDPDEDVQRRVSARQQVLARLAQSRAPGRTSDFHAVDLLANIGTPEDAERIEIDAVQGVGLFRTEVLFLGRESAPAIDEQAAAYARVLQARPGQKVVVRTLDAGADKPLAFVHQGAEPNPALGVRGYRMVRTDPSLLDGQLQALAAAQRRADADPWVMAPMIATAAEAADFAARARGHGLQRVGVMVEVPSAALRIAEILDEVDFVSIGTNDLSQYTMASDRLLGDLADLLDPWQPAVLDLVARVLRTAADAGKPAGICGESAGDPLMALVLTGMGATSLSMAPAAVPAVRFAIAHHSRQQCQRLAQAALAAPAAQQARELVLQGCDDQVRELLR
ncbi:MAG: phosphoenolpyruvate--protein phosphotransferase [Beutenbergiaceae bacterium]